MQTWSITLHGPAGVISTVDTGESQFVIGTETASDVFTVHGDGILPRHAWVWISETGLQVEDLGGGTLVNGYQITERVQVEVPASVQVGEITLAIEVKAVQPVAVSPTPSSLDITIPQRAVTKTKASMEVTIPQRTPTRGNVQKAASTNAPSAKPSSADEASTHCRYTLVREIARGGMGQIYFGEDPQLERQVAVKVSSISEDGEDPRFSKEAKVLAQLAHPNIVPIHNIGVDAKGRPFYSMKLVKGRTLQAVLNQIRDGDAAAVKDYPRATLLTIFRKVCDAMMFAHSKGILHRDLKPENIMVGEYGEVLVMDWGLAKVLGEREEQGSSVSRVNDTGDYGMTMEGEVMGTPQYMSPEQAQGMVAELDQRSDIYSLGGILYAILTLRPPIDGTTLDEVLTKVKNGSISSMVTKRGGKGAVTVGAPNAMGAEVPEALQAVTLKSMATDRNKRYASVELFAADIEAYQNGFATGAEEAGIFRRLVLFGKRHKAFSLSCVALLLFGVVFVIQLRSSERIARLNEKRALEEKDIARRAAAQSQLLLVESAYENCDSEAMLKGLKNIPEDLRDPTWQYFNERVDFSDQKVFPENGKKWTGMQSHPTEPNTFLAIQHDGAFFAIDAITGTKTLQWKANFGGGLNKFAVSDDGLQAAFTVAGQIHIRRVSDGTLIHAIDTEEVVNCSSMVLTKSFLLTYNNKAVYAYSLTEKRLLWKFGLKGSAEKNFRISPDEKELVIVGSDNGIEKLDLLTGNVISKVALNLYGGDINYLNGSVLSPDGRRRFAYVYQRGFFKVRAYELSTGKIQFETSARPGFTTVGAIPAQGLIASLHGSLPRNNALCFHDWNDGSLLRAVPLMGKNEYGHSLHVSGDTLAINFEDAIRLYQTRVSTPEGSLPRFSGEGELTRLGDPERVLASRFASTGTSSGLIISLLDTDGDKPPKQTVNSVSVAKFPRHPGLRLSQNNSFLIAAGDWLCAAFEVKKEGVQTLWGPKPIGSLGDAVPHPTRDLLWTGSEVLQMSTGRGITKVNRVSIGQIKWGPTSLWLDDDHVLEVGIEKVAEIDGDAGEYNRSLILWDAVSGQRSLVVSAPHCSVICRTPDGQSVIEGSSDKRVRIRNASTLKEEVSFRAHDKGVTGLECHPSRPLLVTFSVQESLIRIWNLRDFSMLEEIRTNTKAEKVKISADGMKLLVWLNSKIDLYSPKSFQNEALR